MSTKLDRLMRKIATYTVITGAGRGLGKSIAIEYAKRNRNLVLISLPGENTSRLGEELSQKYKIKAAIHETDLRDENNIRSLARWIKNHFIVDTLVNNAGIGGTRHFSEAEPEYINTIMQLNMKALVLLTHELLPMLKLQKKANILNIASLAAFGPIPYKTVYPASKAFVSSFSKGLNSELKNTSVIVSVAYPGGMLTNPEIIERVKDYGWLVKSTFLSPERAAGIIVSKMLKGKTMIVPGFASKLSKLLMGLIPEQIRLKMFRKNLQKELKINLA